MGYVALRVGRRMLDVLPPLLLREEAKEPVHEDGEEHRRLLEGHEDARELLILERAETPDAMVSLDVEVVDRARDQCHHEAHRASEDERGEDVGGSPARPQAMRLVLEDAPPHRE